MRTKGLGDVTIEYFTWRR